jgi:methionyl aminopeptidase
LETFSHSPAASRHFLTLSVSVCSFDFTGHGIGRVMHDGLAIPHFGKPGRGPRIVPGMVFTIEPMINTGTWMCKIDDNGWTARTLDGGLSCQYEHTIAITEEGPLIMTLQEDEPWNKK